MAEVARAEAFALRLETLDFHVLGVAVCCEQALDMAAHLIVDLALVDIRLPGEAESLETARLLRESLGVAVVIVADQPDRESFARMGKVGVLACLAPSSPDRECLATVEMAWHTARRERRYLASRQCMALTLDSLNEGLIVADAAGRVRRINPVARTLLGLDPDEALGQPLASVYRLQGEQNADTVVLADRNIGRHEGLLACAEGQSVFVEQTLSPIRDPGGERLGTMVVFRDIGWRRRSEQALRQSLDNHRRALEQTVIALTVTSEKRDPFTAGHQERVSRLALAIARELGLPEDVREGVRLAGLVHDIGKIHVPSEILAKPETLSDLEMGIVQGHCEVGYEILKDVPFSWPVARMVLEHHERLDGSGYPAGLSGEGMLPESRILAVADVLEAMTAHRPYRAAHDLERTLAELRGGRGNLYDPAAVDACLRLCAGGSLPL
jgi:PAS domain S-box-containing protein/putative nucleotidyltransferase with HDIG domain